MVIAKLSRTIENLTSKITQVISRHVQTKSNRLASESLLLDIMSELSPDSEGIQREVAEFTNTNQ